MQACGLSLVRLLRPVGLVSILAWAATSYVYLVAVPDSNQAFREIAFNVLASKAEGEVRPRAFFDEFPNLVLYVQDIPADGLGWNGVFLSDRRPNTPSAVYVARHGRVAIDRAEADRRDAARERRPPHHRSEGRLRSVPVRSAGDRPGSRDLFPAPGAAERRERADHRRVAAAHRRAGTARAVGAQRADEDPPEVLDPGGLPGVRPDRDRARGDQPARRRARQLCAGAGGDLPLLRADVPRSGPDQGRVDRAVAGRLAAQHRPRRGGTAAVPLAGALGGPAVPDPAAAVGAAPPPARSGPARAGLDRSPPRAPVPCGCSIATSPRPTSASSSWRRWGWPASSTSRRSSICRTRCSRATPPGRCSAPTSSTSRRSTPTTSCRSRCCWPRWSRWAC